MANVLLPKRLDSGIEKLKADFPVSPPKILSISLVVSTRSTPSDFPFFSQTPSSAGSFKGKL